MPIAWRRWIPARRDVVRDSIAGVPGAVGSVPDGMAAALLGGVNPIHGLYASFAGPIAGGLTSSTQFMVITTTSAAALAAGSAIEGVPAKQRAEAMFLLTAIAGIAMVAAGLLRLGRFTRFVSYSVMRGFLTGVAVNIILGQLPDFTGAGAKGSLAIEKALHVVTHPTSINGKTLVIGVMAALILLGAARTRLSPFAALLALVVPTVVASAAGWNSIALVRSKGAIPRGLPTPALPHLSLLSLPLLGGALAVAAVVLVQGVGVSDAVPNPDGSSTDVNRDFLAEGAGNLSSAFFLGQPVGGSVGQTALNRTAGARTRWAAIFSGIWMIAILAVFSPVIAKVALTTLAAVLIVAAASSLSPTELINTWRAGPNSQIALVSTFVATLFLTIPAAVGLGVFISLVLQLNREALDLRLVRLEVHNDHLVETEPPANLPSNDVLLLDIYGSLLYAGSRTLQMRLPDPSHASHSAVVLRLRGRGQLGNTFLHVVEDYATRLNATGGRLFLSGVSPGLKRQVAHSRLVERAAIEVIDEVPTVGAASSHAFQLAKRWLAEGPTDPETTNE